MTDDWRLWLTRDEHEHVSIEGLKKLLAVARAAKESDEELLYETLQALQEVNEALIPTVIGTNSLSMMARRTRAAIKKMQERLK